MNSLDIVLPILLIMITYALKLFIDQTVDIPAAVRSVCELPIDIVFLSISLLIAIVVSNAENRNIGLVVMLGNIFAAILIVFLSKRSASNYDAGLNKKWRWLLSINMFIAIMSLCISIGMLQPTVKEFKKETVQAKKNGN